MDDRFLKRLRKKAKKGMRGWPVATIAFYGPDLDRASKVAVGIIPTENSGARDMRTWHAEHGDIRASSAIAEEVLDFIQEQGALTVIMTDGIMGCPHQQGIDYEGEWCPVCDFWRGRDRFTGEMIS
jgi:hypothetical protein